MINHQHVRVSVIHRDGEKDWAGTGRYLNIRAYTNHTNTKLHPYGTDIPIWNTELSDDFIERLIAGNLDLSCLPPAMKKPAAPSSPSRADVVKNFVAASLAIAQ